MQWPLFSAQEPAGDSTGPVLVADGHRRSFAENRIPIKLAADAARTVIGIGLFSLLISRMVVAAPADTPAPPPALLDTKETTQIPRKSGIGDVEKSGVGVVHKLKFGCSPCEVKSDNFDGFNT